MKTMLEVCMYSGACAWDPRCEIAPDQERILMEKVGKLHKKAPMTRFGTGVLGTDSFAVNWGIIEIREDGFEIAPNYMDFLKGLRVISVHAWPERVRVDTWENGTQASHVYEDTESIHSFLADLAAPAIQAHYKRANEQIQAYWDNMGSK